MDTRVDVPLPVVRTLVGRARLAPSPRNTQPWRWSAHADGERGAVAEVELFRVGDRWLSAGDPGGRELVISCGAALLTFRVAAAEALLRTEVDVLPDPNRPDLLARVRFVAGTVDAAFSGLDAAVTARHTWRRAFAGDRIPGDLADRFAVQAAGYGVRVHALTDQQRPPVAALVRECDTVFYRDPGRRAEAASWLRPRWRGDGVPTPVVRLLPARLAVRHTDIGRRLGAERATLLMNAPVAVVLWTPGDDTASWLATGQALQHLLLVAAKEGLSAGFVNRPCQDPRHRAELRDVLGFDGAPQVLLRLGHVDAPWRPVPRLPLDDVLGAGWPESAGSGAADGTDDGLAVEPDSGGVADELG
ncbi:MAG: nitroreductase family protein [Kineosporiaceae bacterium]|jgi:nitroreductase